MVRSLRSPIKLVTCMPLRVSGRLGHACATVYHPPRAAFSSAKEGVRLDLNPPQSAFGATENWADRAFANGRQHRFSIPFRRLHQMRQNTSRQLERSSNVNFGFCKAASYSLRNAMAGLVSEAWAAGLYAAIAAVPTMIAMVKPSVNGSPGRTP